ncbi:MAG: fatty acid desaturase [Pseudomonadota bacterium]
MLCRRSDRAGLVQAGLHLGLIIAGGAYVAWGLPLWGLVLVAQGILVTFLFTALHETIHRTAFAARWLNDAMAWIAGFAVFLPPDYFRYFHLAHHRHTHDPERDPELAGGKPDTPWRLAIYLTGVPEFLDRPRLILRNALWQNPAPWIPEGGKAKVQGEARVYAVVYAVLALGSVALGTDLLLWVWILPLLAGGPFLRVYLLAEHSLCPHVSNMFENTRTTFTGWLVRMIAWNMPYHAEHHAFPAVPFHKLPDFHARARAHLRETETGYVQFAGRYVSDPAAAHNSGQNAAAKPM